MFNDIYRNKKVFLTGHTGFKGSWLALWLANLGARVCGYALEPPTNPSMFNTLKTEEKIEKSIIGNILDEKKLELAISEFKPDIVFHLAAQPLVRLSYREPLLTYRTNVIGTLNVLHFANCCSSVKAFVNVTTDKCYENKELAKGYKESDPMGGYDMYSSSKGCVEIMSSSFRHSFLNNENSMMMATARAGNVIGGGDWAEDRLVPDCIRYINKNKAIEIRKPLSIRPWQYVLEPLSGYLLLGQKLLETYKTGNKIYANGFNFGPNEDSVLKVSEVAQKIIKYYGEGEIVIYNTDDLHEANFLMLNIDKVQKVLGWIPTYTADIAIEKTVEWYKHFYNKDVNMYDFTMKQIKQYEEHVKWNKNYAVG